MNTDLGKVILVLLQRGQTIVVYLQTCCISALIGQIFTIIISLAFQNGIDTKIIIIGLASSSKIMLPIKSKKWHINQNKSYF